MIAVAVWQPADVTGNSTWFRSIDVYRCTFNHSFFIARLHSNQFKARYCYSSFVSRTACLSICTALSRIRSKRLNMTSKSGDSSFLRTIKCRNETPTMLRLAEALSTSTWCYRNLASSLLLATITDRVINNIWSSCADPEFVCTLQPAGITWNWLVSFAMHRVG